MYKYERIIYWSNDDNAFIVEVPELPGCMADGKTIEEAIANAEIIIKEWIEQFSDSYNANEYIFKCTANNDGKLFIDVI